MKYKIKTANRAKSRRLTFYTELSAGVGVGASIASLVLGDNVPLAIGSIVCEATSAIIEIVNISGPRLKWIQDINQAVSGKKQKSYGFEESVSICPVFATEFDPLTQQMDTRMGARLRIKL